MDGLQMLESQRFSDFKIVCRGYEFNVHRAVLCVSSPVLLVTCTGGFSREVETQRVVYDEFSPTIMSRVILYIYTKKYDASSVPPMFKELATDPTEVQLGKSSPEPEVVEDEVDSSSPDDWDPEWESSSMKAVRLVKATSKAKPLKVNILVYKVADYLGVKGLAEFASAKINALSDEYLFHLDPTVEGLEFMLDELPARDRGLRLQIAAFLAKHQEEARQVASLDQALDCHTDGLWGVFKTAMDEQKQAEERAVTAELGSVLSQLDQKYIGLSSRLEPTLIACLAHFQDLQETGRISQFDETTKCTEWKTAIVSGLNGSAPPFADNKHKLSASLFDKYASMMMCSLFLSETTYSYFSKMSKAQFEIMHAPRLYEFLESTMAPYAWRSDQVISHYHPIEQHFDWDVALRLVCSVGAALRRAQHDRTDDFDYYTAGFGDRSGEKTRTRFELILENECAKVGLLPADRGEKVRRDFLVDNPGLSNPPRISSLAKNYHGATYVPQPNPVSYDVFFGGFQADRKERDWALVNSRTFEPKDLALETIRTTQKEWSIVWTSSLEEHLWVEDFKIFKNLASHRQQLVRETDKYSVNSRPLKPFEKVTKKVNPIDPFKKPYKGLLDTWLATPCPHHITQVFAHNGQTADVRTGLVSEMTIGEVLALLPDSGIPEDLVIQLQGILLYPHTSTTENYSEYPYFGERLQYLNYVLQSQKPRNLSELWRDQRDSLQWWTFWLVAWFGIASVLLALGSLVASVAQTWAAFRALGLN
ncbi:hypothetical protein LTR84_001368 [Exophiala bonariae]|uniref:BTB domain-containing protein n=1 Tax=Exophiala bonariae TaxID=1690606 RepID=A0AAV9NDA3_9EURO|nr:hypothetical protein LTR84_001368 [Exophiala bonariae]